MLEKACQKNKWVLSVSYTSNNDEKYLAHTHLNVASILCLVHTHTNTHTHIMNGVNSETAHKMVRVS